jgi:membrane-bound serine protease (ClpP class)
MIRLLAVYALLTVLELAAPSAASAADESYVAVGRLQGVVNPASASYVERAIGAAEAGGATLFVLELDTPGGLDSSMRRIVQRVLASATPVVVYVAPPGARAGSAGVYITYSAHLAAMAPNTNIGSATPVSMGERGEAAMSDEMRAKVTNDAVAYIKGLAAARGRNADWAEQAVRQAVNVHADEARAEGIVEYVATDVQDLLRQLDGAQVTTALGPRVLQTANVPVRRDDMQPLERLLHAISDPTIAYLLLSLGTLALVYELSNPGAILPGVAGGLSLLLALYALGTLPVNLAGLLLLALAFGLLLLDVFAPTHGVLTAGAIAAFVFGSAILINTPEGAPFLSIAPAAIVLVTAVLVAFFGLIVGSVARSQRRRAVGGAAALIGQRAVVREPLEPSGLVLLHGELWTARTAGNPIPIGAEVEVLAVEGLRLVVREATESPALPVPSA